MMKSKQNRLLKHAIETLQSGADTGKLARSLAVRCGVGCARRIADTASACLWLAEGIQVADVLTMIESRHRFEFSPADCRAYAVEILWAANEELHATNPRTISYRKESHHAIA